MGGVCNGCQPTFVKPLTEAALGDYVKYYFRNLRNMPKTYMWPKLDITQNLPQTTEAVLFFSDCNHINVAQHEWTPKCKEIKMMKYKNGFKLLLLSSQQAKAQILLYLGFGLLDIYDNVT